MFHQKIQSFRQIPDTCAVVGGSSDDGNAQGGRESGEIEPEPAPFGFVHEIDADQHPGDKLQGLQGQIQAAFQAGCVTDNYGRVCASKAQEIPGNFFFR